jgi:predicted ribosome quality control (RQC) complex YloA/Tae2 family protein
MKSINFQEFHRVVELLKAKIISAQLQEVYHFESGVVLGFYAQKTFWLVIDLSTTPMILLYENDRPPVVKSQKPKPVTLFINSHFKNRPLAEIKYQTEWGRRALFYFSELNSGFYIEVILIPNHSNIIVYSEGKKLSWAKQQDIDFSIPGDKSSDIEEFRSPAVLKEEWQSKFNSKTSVVKDEKKVWQLKAQKDIAKKQSAILKIQESIGGQKEELYYQIGEFLKYNPLSELPSEWVSFVDSKKTKDWNRENVFQKAKNFEKKKIGANLRIEKIKQEIEQLEKSSYEESLKKAKHNISAIKSQTLDLRKLELSQQAIAYMGKNAQSNMDLLKQSQSWDIWFHLKDYPSSFVIVRKNKNYKLTNDDLTKVIDWFIKESLGNKKDIAILSFDIIYTECRFVRPIKGDKIGRVNYSQEKNFRWKMKN